MKKKIIRREIKPKPGSRAKIRDGLFCETRRIAENYEDLEELVRTTQGVGVGEEEWLKAIQASAESLLSDQGFPVPWTRHYIFFSDDTWEYLPENIDKNDGEKIRSHFDGKEIKIMDFGSGGLESIIDPLSPEYFACKTIFYSSVALKQLKSGDNSVVRSAMNAVDYYHKMRFSFLYELPAIIGLNQEQSWSEGGSSRSIWSSRQSELQQEINNKHIQFPESSYENLKKLVVKDFRDNEDVTGLMAALKRYTVNPKKR